MPYLLLYIGYATFGHGIEVRNFRWTFPADELVIAYADVDAFIVLGVAVGCWEESFCRAFEATLFCRAIELFSLGTAEDEGRKPLQTHAVQRSVLGVHDVLIQRLVRAAHDGTVTGQPASHTARPAVTVDILAIAAELIRRPFDANMKQGAVVGIGEVPFTCAAKVGHRWNGALLGRHRTTLPGYAIGRASVLLRTAVGSEVHVVAAHLQTQWRRRAVLASVAGRSAISLKLARSGEL